MQPKEKTTSETKQTRKVKLAGEESQLSLSFGENFMEVEIDIESFIMG